MRRTSTAAEATARGLTERDRLEARFEAVFESSLDAIALFDPHGRFLRANRAAAELFGTPAEELIGSGLERFIPERGRDAIRGTWERLARDGTLRERIPIVRGDGTCRTIEYASLANVIQGEHLTVIRDVTEAIHAEGALREAKERFEAAFTHAPIAMALVPLEGPFAGSPFAANAALCEILGYTLDELAAVPAAALSHPEDLGIGIAETAAVLTGEIRTCSIEKRFLGRGGEPIWVRMQVSLVPSSSNPRYAVCQIEDITERRRAEQVLRESEARFRRLADNSDDVIFLYRILPEPGYEYVSPSATRVTGYSPEEHYADPLLAERIIHPEDRARLGASEGHFDGTTTLRWIHKDGHVVHTEQTLLPITDESGELVAVQGAVRDVTARHHEAEERRRLADIVDASHDAIMATTLDGVITAWNRGASRIFGHADTDATGRPLSVLQPLDSGFRLEAPSRRFATGSGSTT